LRGLIPDPRDMLLELQSRAAKHLCATYKTGRGAAKK
jgi:hypothetical protein